MTMMSMMPLLLQVQGQFERQLCMNGFRLFSFAIHYYFLSSSSSPSPLFVAVFFPTRNKIWWMNQNTIESTCCNVFVLHKLMHIGDNWVSGAWWLIVGCCTLLYCCCCCVGVCATFDIIFKVIHTWCFTFTCKSNRNRAVITLWCVGVPFSYVGLVIVSCWIGISVKTWIVAVIVVVGFRVN